MPEITLSGLYLDSSSNKLTVVDYAHHESHDGNAFQCHYVQAVTETNDRSIITLKTPDTTKSLHMIFAAGAVQLSYVYIWEAPTIGASQGTNLTVFNKDRNSSNTSGILSTKDATANSATYFSIVNDDQVTGGIEIHQEFLGAGTKNQSGGGASRDITEFILLRNTIYAFEIKSYNANDNIHSLSLDWYEHRDKQGGV
ncbi:MAG: hypothetical protein KAI94_13045 [Anaerolineales bacterium]|nr:hypothetical protein [Anaerolineales bacterium]